MYWEAVSRTGVNLSETLRTVNHLVHSGELDWQLLFYYTNEATDELETIFFTDGLLTEYNPSGPISINGRRYDDLLLFLNQTALRSFLNNERQHPSFGGFVNFGFNNFGLSEVFVVGADALRDTRDFDFNADEPLPPFDYLILSAISGSPIHHAIRELFFVYMITFVIAAFAVFVTRRKLIKNIIEPVEALVKGYNAFNGGSDRHKYLDCGTPKWSEPFELTRIYMDTTEELHKSRIKENEEDEHNKA
jgi:sensor histidine kinase YesM